MATADSVGHIPVWVRPLAIIELEFERMIGEKASLSADQLLGFAGGTGRPISCEEVIRRYKEISTGALDMFAVPANEVILEKLVWPLKGAKVCYCLGQNLACLAMAGLVGEMCAILLFDAKRPRAPGANWPQGSDFEKMGQLDRIRTLSNLGLADAAVSKHLKELQGLRRKYLHFLSSSHRQLPADARKAYRAAFAIVQRVVGLIPRTGAFQIDTDILHYVKKGKCP